MKNQHLSRFALLLGAVVLLGSAPALAGHPSVDEMPAVQRTAHTVESLARDLHRLVERRRHAPRWAVSAFHALEQQAAHFHDEVERYARDPGHTEGDFRELIAAYQRARRASHTLGWRGSRMFSQLDWQIRQLTRAYAVESFDRRRVMRLAHDLHEKSEHLHRELERDLGRHHRITASERRAIIAVHRLAEAAEHLHEVVESRSADSRHSRDDARKVARLFDRAGRAMASVHPSPHLERDFQRLHSTVTQLRRLYRLPAPRRYRPTRAWRH